MSNKELYKNGLTEDFIMNHLEEFELVTISSNRIYRLNDKNCRYILKINNLPPDDLSPFWRGLQEVFSSSFDTQRENIEETLALLENPHIKVAQLVMKSNRYRFQVFKEAEGISYEPDEFPNSYEIEYQLGQFIGFIHSKQYDYFGHPSSHTYSGFKEKALHAMSETICKYWSDSEVVKKMYEKVSTYDVSPNSYSLIMADISANQFLFGDDMKSISALVDFDAYVIAPREWELAVIEMCLKDGKAFRKGYEEYRPFPDMSKDRDFYRFYMYLCDPWEKQDLSDFMSRNIIF